MAAVVAKLLWTIGVSAQVLSGSEEDLRLVEPDRRPHVSAVRVQQPPLMDGQLDDPIWRSATRITSFVQEEPVEGAPPTEATEVYVAYDSQQIYIGIYAHYADPGVIRASRSDRDQINNDDRVTVFFDPFLDQQRAYAFGVNAYGVQSDAVLGGGGRGRGGGRGGGPGDSSWDALFYSAGVLVKDGWTAELILPFKSLRYPSRSDGEAHRWGFQIQRHIEAKNETVVWAPISRDVMGFLRQMGVLEGLAGLSSSRNFELLPSITAVGTKSLDEESGAYTRSGVREAGVNVKYGVTSNLTLDFTLNPDFSQIESDRPQIEVNQRFPLFFSELRPFFLEGQEIFNVSGPVNLIHTRTIVDPRYGAKLTGKVGDVALGLVVANDEAPGHVEDAADRAFGQSAQVTIARLRYDFLTDSNVGVIVTDREFLDAYSRIGGVDAQLRFGANQRIGFRAVTARHRDEEGVDRRGSMVDVDFRKDGRNLRYSANHFSIGPDFDTDVGFVRRVDQRQTGGSVAYRWWPQTWVTNWGPSVDYSRNYSHAGVLQDEELGLRVSVQLARNIFLNSNLDRSMERYAGIDFEKTGYSFGGRINTSQKVSFGGFMNLGDQIRYDEDDPYLGSGRGFYLSGTLRPFSRLQSELRVNTSRLFDRRNGRVEFDVKIYRSETTYQFTDRLLVRAILEHNSFDKTLGSNLLVTYRVNSGTVFYLGYDDRYRRGDHLDPLLFPAAELQRTNVAFFTKLQVLFRQ